MRFSCLNGTSVDVPKRYVKRRLRPCECGAPGGRTRPRRSPDPQGRRARCGGVRSTRTPSDRAPPRGAPTRGRTRALQPQAVHPPHGSSELRPVPSGCALPRGQLNSSGSSPMPLLSMRTTDHPRPCHPWTGTPQGSDALGPGATRTHEVSTPPRGTGAPSLKPALELEPLGRCQRQHSRERPPLRSLFYVRGVG